MTHVFHDLIIGGVFVSPIVTYALIALVLILVLRPILHQIGFSRYFARPPVAELSLYITVFGLLTLLF